MINLRVLIGIAPQRLPQYEKEIFSDTELACYYINNLTNQYGWSNNARTISGVARMAAMYAVTVMKQRWPEVEHLVMLDEYSLFTYTSRLGISRRQLLTAHHNQCSHYHNHADC